MALTLADFSDCLDTLEGTTAELESLESELAERYRLPVGSGRALLLGMDERGELDDSPLVADWRATYARFLDWTNSP